MTGSLLLAAFGGLIGLGVTLALSRMSWWQPSKRAAERLKTLTAGHQRPSPAQERRLARKSQLFLEEAKGYRAQLRRRILAHAGRIGGVRMVWLLAAAVAAVCVTLVLVVRSLDPLGPVLNPILVVAGAGVAGLALHSQLARRWQIAFLNGFADAIDLMIRAVRSGIPVSEAIRTAGHEVSDPVRQEFSFVSDALDLGMDLKEAMQDAAERIRLADFDFLVTALVIQRESGGQLAETLEGLSAILRRRKELRLKIKALTAEGRMSAVIVGAIPIVAALAMYVLDPGHVERLFVPGTGQTMLAIGLGCLAAGIGTIHLLTRVRP